MFNALVKSSVAEAANYPFCTIEPNVGIVDIPDEKLPQLAQIAKAEKIVPAAIEFVDIAGLVRGASQGEGLGNKFLSHIREVDAIILVLRGFHNENVINTQDSVHPERDAQIIDLELILADMETVSKRKESIHKDLKAGKEEAQILAKALELALPHLESEQPLRTLSLTDKQANALQQMQLLTMKPFMIVLNADENEIGNPIEALRERYVPNLSQNYPLVPVSAKIESEIAQLSQEEAKEFMESLGMTESGLDKVAKAAYSLLGLQSYYTAGEKEARAWTIKQGSTAPQAAGVIHGDFERGFIAAEIISFNDFISLGGWSGGRPAGKVRTEGKTYVMQPDDVVLFRFNV
ncbi:MAG TPA: redox-regulated ATPase YchF [Patescibacteria group bacterium]